MEQNKEPLKLTSFAEIEYEEPAFILKPYIPKGKLTILQGEPGVGKTAAACSLAAIVSTGQAIEGDELHETEKRPVIMLSVEDDLPILRGRIEADGGDIGNIYAFSQAAELSFTDERVEQLIKEVGAGLVVFDPLQAFLGSNVDMYRANETRPVLARLADVAARNDCAIVIISHERKGDGKAIHKGLGSIDIVGASRSVVKVGYNPDNKGERVMIHIKSNMTERGESLAYSIQDRGRVEWKGHSSLTESDIDRAAKREESGIDYEDEPTVQVIRKLIGENPGGLFVTYEDMEKIGADLLDYPIAKNSTELGKRLNALKYEMATKDGIIVQAGDKARPKAFMWNGAIFDPLKGSPSRGATIRQKFKSKQAHQQPLTDPETGRSVAL